MNWRISRIFSTIYNSESRRLLHDRHRRNLYDLHNEDEDHLVNGLQLRNLDGLRTDGTTWICLCATTFLRLNAHNLPLQCNCKVQHSDEELDLRHLQLLVRLGLLELELREQGRPPTAASRLSQPAQEPTVGAPWRRSRRMSVDLAVSLCTGCSPRGPGPPPESSRPDGQSPLPLQTPGKTRDPPAPTQLCGRSEHHSRLGFSPRIARSEPKPRPGVGLAG